MAAATVFAALLGAGVVSGCGDDDEDDGAGGDVADCSKCASSLKSDCEDLASDCARQGGSVTDCQVGVDALCAIGGIFDGGLDFDGG